MRCHYQRKRGSRHFGYRETEKPVIFNREISEVTGEKLSQYISLMRYFISYSHFPDRLVRHRGGSNGYKATQEM